MDKVKTAIEHGLSESDALAALTINPAEMIEMSHRLGTLEKGKLANFIVSSAPIFEDAELISNWIQGKDTPSIRQKVLILEETTSALKMIPLKLVAR